MRYKLKELSNEEMISQLEEWKSDIDQLRLDFSNQCHAMCIEINEAIVKIKCQQEDADWDDECTDDEGDDSRSKVNYKERHRAWEMENTIK